MYKDIISYELAENVSKEQLLTIAEEIYKDWMKKQPGFISWEINAGADGSFTDIVYWESKEHAKKAEKEMIKIPHANDWFACYKDGTISTKNVSIVKKF